MKADFASVKEPRDGEMIVLLTDSFDPATLDHERAIRALLALKGVSSVWACPLGGYGKEAKDMCTILCSAIGDRRLGMCTMAFDTDVRLPQAARDMCLKRFKGLKFKIAAVAERFAAQADFVVQFGNSAGISP